MDRSTDKPEAVLNLGGTFGMSYENVDRQSSEFPGHWGLRAVH
jgi:hypothetical protein